MLSNSQAPGAVRRRPATQPILVKLNITKVEEDEEESCRLSRWVAIKVKPKEETLESLRVKISDAINHEESFSDAEVESILVYWNTQGVEDAHTHLECVESSMLKTVLELMVVRSCQDWLEVGIIA